MIRQRKRQWVEKAGGQVPAYVQRMMERRHPTCHILWHLQHNRWSLWQEVRGELVLIRVLGGNKRFEAPTLANTVYFLDACHPARYQNQYERERLLAELDRNDQARTITNRSRDRIREGSKDLFNKLNNRIVIARQ